MAPVIAVGPPPASALAPFPLSWYPFGPASELRAGPVSRPLFGQPIVVFRTGSGRLAALDARCSHLAADLGRGAVVGNCVRCPFHHWQYGADGVCTRAPGNDAVPDFARQRTFAVEERHGWLYVFSAAEPLFGLPFFPGAEPAGMTAGRPLTYPVDVSWHMFASNLFDEAHLEWVHGRRAPGGLVIDTPHPLARRVRFSAEVVPLTTADRLLKRISGGVIETEITCWGGTYFVGRGRLGRFQSWIIVANVPRIGQPNLECFVRAYVPRGANRLVSALTESLSLAVRRFFVNAFMLRDFQQIVGVQYRPASLTPADRCLAEFFAWAATLPRAAWPD